MDFSFTYRENVTLYTYIQKTSVTKSQKQVNLIC